MKSHLHEVFIPETPASCCEPFVKHEVWRLRRVWTLFPARVVRLCNGHLVSCCRNSSGLSRCDFLFGQHEKDTLMLSHAPASHDGPNSPVKESDKGRRILFLHMLQGVRVFDGSLDGCEI